MHKYAKAVRLVMQKFLYRTLLYAAPWLFLSLLFIFPNMVIDYDRPSTLGDREIILHILLVYMLWALFTPLIVAWQRRYPLGWPLRRKPLLMHMALLLTLMTVHAAVISLDNMYSPVFPDTKGFWNFFLPELRWRGPYGAILYSAIIFALAARAAISREHARERGLVQAQLEALKARIEPHFLFNVLNALSELVYTDAKATDRVLTQLATLFRQSLDQRVLVHALGDELNLLRLYLAIQRTLLEERLQLRWDIRSEVLAAEVPALLLQPIVENAVRHGIARLPEGGTLIISASTNSARNQPMQLVIRVQNDGPKNPVVSVNEDGVGLHNTRARLQAMYGEAHGCNLSLRNEGGAIVELTMPLRHMNLAASMENSPTRESASNQTALPVGIVQETKI